ncbi:hypothetical protein O3M35_010754 [Rhynocoris fuscipes]|uniref:Uncharacterized protein n=1 Tax=Rhynocoris fuscipes TaxID=488301 RepID=A0AAW1D3A4_9HEMI
MVRLAVALTTLASLATLVLSYNTNRRTSERDIDGLPNNIDGVFIVFEDILTENSSSPSRTVAPTDGPTESVTDPDPLSVVWYLGAFGGLIAFFLVVTFSEWCCASKHLYRRHALNAPYISGYSSESRAPETPPPPYHLFAPPPYSEATCYEKSVQAPIFIIPVHQAPITCPPSSEQPQQQAVPVQV